VPRGRALQPVRPGLVIKSILMGTQPLITPPTDQEQTVMEACATDIHYTYQTLINRENQTREHGNRLKGLRTASFNTVWRFLRVLGMIEFVREEPMLYPPPHGNLLSIRKDVVGEFTLRNSARRVFRITEFGIQEEVAWNDVTKAYKDFVKQGNVRWPEPRKMQVAVPIEGEILNEVPSAEEQVTELPELPEIVVEEPRPSVKVIRRPKKEKKITKFTLGTRPTPTNFKILLEHIDTLEESRMGNVPLFDSEMDYIGTKVGDWQVEAEDIPERYGKFTEKIRMLYSAVENIDFGEMRSILDEMITPTEE
jgi:hypothetical protein